MIAPHRSSIRRARLLRLRRRILRLARAQERAAFTSTTEARAIALYTYAAYLDGRAAVLLHLARTGGEEE